RELERVVRCGRALCNVALEQRITWWRRGRGRNATRFQPESEPKEIRAALPDYGVIPSPVLQDVLARLDRTSQDCFRRRASGEQPGFAGFPRCPGAHRYHSFPSKERGNGARLDNGFLVLSKIGRIAVRWSRPIEGTPTQDRHHLP